MDKNKLVTIGSVLISIGLLYDNWRIGKKYEKQKSFADLMVLQNQTYRYMIKGLVNPSVDAKTFGQELATRMKFISIVTGIDHVTKEG